VKAIIYARFSPRPNAEESESIETQLDYGRKYCEEHGLEVAGEYSDRALSGEDEDRPGLWAAVDALRRGNVLVVYRLDRLARSVYLSEYIRRQVEKRKARIEAVQGGGNGESPEETFIRQVLQAEAEYSRKVTAARTKYAMLRHQAAGRRMGSRIPYGWKQDPANPMLMTKDEGEQATIARIVALRKQGLTLRGIKAVLEAEGRPFRDRPTWNHTTVQKVLKRAGMS
jgi:DNA invertase Pin-like site-specific DNA recombinase